MNIAMILAIAYLLGPSAFFTHQTPQPLSAWRATAGRDTILVPGADGTPLRGFVYRSSRARLWILRFYGANGGALVSDTFDRSLSKTYGATVVVVDYRGYGFTPGHPTFALAQDDALRIYDRVRTLAGNLPVVVYGASLGSSMATHVAVHRPVAGVVLQGAMSDAHSMVRFYELQHLGPLGYFVEADADGTSGMANADRLRHIRAPLLILHGAEDRNISVEDARVNDRAAQSVDKTLVVVPGSAHQVRLDGTAAGRALERFLARAGRRRATTPGMFGP